MSIHILCVKQVASHVLFVLFSDLVTKKLSDLTGVTQLTGGSFDGRERCLDLSRQIRTAITTTGIHRFGGRLLVND